MFRRRGGTQWSGTVVAMAAARRAAATHPSPAGLPGELAPRAGRRPPGRVARARTVAVPGFRVVAHRVVTPAALTAGIPLVAATGRPAAGRRGSLARRRAVPA